MLVREGILDMLRHVVVSVLERNSTLIPRFVSSYSL